MDGGIMEDRHYNEKGELAVVYSYNSYWSMDDDSDEVPIDLALSKKVVGKLLEDPDYIFSREELGTKTWSPICDFDRINLAIKWVPKGSYFRINRIHEEFGIPNCYEEVEIFDIENWEKA